MTLKLLPAKIPEDVPELINLCYTSFENPRQAHFEVLHPIFGDRGPAERQKAIQSSVDRTLARNARDPTETWLKMVDENSVIVAGALYNTFEENPYEHYEPTVAVWWPEGPQREYVNQLMDQHDRPMAELAAKPHMMLKILFTHPDHRNAGAGGALLQWGVERASERQYEIWLSSWGMATEYYRQRGFDVVREVRTQPVPKDGNAPPGEWDELNRRWQPLTSWVMRRRVA